MDYGFINMYCQSLIKIEGDPITLHILLAGVGSFSTFLVLHCGAKCKFPVPLPGFDGESGMQSWKLSITGE